MAAILYRPLKGSRISTFYPVKSLAPLASLDSAFQLQEYISLLIRLDIHDVDTIVSIPESARQKDDADDTHTEGEKDAKNDVTVDEACWIYEQLRRLAQDLSHPLITMLQQECTRTSCPEMKAGEWLYLCVAHGNEGAMEQCCAIDYILHTVDSATALLNSPRAFPSRLSIPNTSNRHFGALARRLGRIFAHAFFHHREIFEQAEAESSLYARFLALTSKYDLVPPEFLVIPTRLSPEDPTHVEPPRLLAAAVDPDHGRGLGLEHLPPTSDTNVDRSPPNEPSSSEQNPSPRKGRSRTDTMVFSEAYVMAEELSKANKDDLADVDDVPLSAPSSQDEPDVPGVDPALARESEEPPVLEDTPELAPSPAAAHAQILEVIAPPSHTSEEPASKEEEPVKEEETPTAPEEIPEEIEPKEIEPATSSAPDEPDSPPKEEESEEKEDPESQDVTDHDDAEPESAPEPASTPVDGSNDPSPKPVSEQQKDEPEPSATPEESDTQGEESDVTDEPLHQPEDEEAEEEVVEAETKPTEPEDAPAPGAGTEGDA
ncbi:Mob1/phocein [Amylostereum chailletii]|nr:Mob1/phocein [Amylostereum chailletii]